MPRLKNLIKRANREGDQMGILVWGFDQVGPFQTVPYPDPSREPQGKPACQPHRHLRNGTAKLMGLFHLATRKVRVKGVRSCPNTVLHPWLKEQLRAILKALSPPPEPPQPRGEPDDVEKLAGRFDSEQTLPEELPPLRIKLVFNLTGHKSPESLLWMFARRIMVLYARLGASWLNMAESVQRMLKRRALDGQYPKKPEQIIEWLEATARGWNRNSTPFKWIGRRAARRERAPRRRHPLGGSGACTRRPIRRRSRTIWRNGSGQTK
jgi:hypothetical protein